MTTSSISEELLEKLKEEFQNGKSLRQLEIEYGVNRKKLSLAFRQTGMHTDKSYSEEIVTKAMEMYMAGKSIRQITIALGVDKNIIANRLHEIGVRSKHIPKNNKAAFKRTLSTDGIVELYIEERLSIQALADLYSRSTNYIWRILKEYGVSETNRLSRKHNFNESAFDIINSPEKAYWLGFLYADGYVYWGEKFGVEVTLKESDYDHLDKFLRFMNADDVQIAEKWVNLNNQMIKVWRVCLWSKKLAADLTKHGCMTKKSLVLQFPKIMLKELLHHFMRGYFDGDGCLSSHYIKKDNHTVLTFGVVGTKKFCDNYEAVLYEIGINQTKYDVTGQAFQTRHHGNAQARIFFSFLYKDATVYLDRKYDKFTAVLGGNT